MRASYSGLPLQERHVIDAKLVSNVISRHKRGKAADIAGVSAEHLLHSHPSVDLVLYKLFNLIIKRGYVPSGFRYSYIVPVPKINDCRSKELTCDDFRGIAISPVISKVFEHCLLDKFQTFFTSCSAQYGF